MRISEEMRHAAGKEQTAGLQVQDPDPCGWGETHTIPRTEPGTHVLSLQGDTSSPVPAPGAPRPLVRTPGLCWLDP